MSTVLKARMLRLPEDFSGAKSDLQLVDFWLTGRPEQTEVTYRRDAVKFLAAVAPKALPELTVADVIAWIKTLRGTNTYVARRLISIKSLLTFGRETGYCTHNVSKAIRLRRTKGTLHARLIEASTVKSMTAAAALGRDRTLLRAFYSTAGRVSEVVGLSFEDLGVGVVTFFGKGSKTRTVSASPEVIAEMLALCGPDAAKGTPVFRNCHGRRLSVRGAQRIVEKARTDRSGVSPHWLRHAHATHSLDNGAQIHKLQYQLGHANISTTNVYVHVRAGQGTAEYVNP